MNFERANNIARSSRSVVKLHVSDHSEALKLVRLGTYAKVLGSGITALDFGSRVGEIHTEYKAGGDWHKTMFVESASFWASTVAGATVAKVGTAGLGFLMAATPIGWVGLIVAGTVLVAASAGVAYGANYYLKDAGAAGSLYDNIMSGISKMP